MDKEKISDSMIDELKEIIDFTPIPDGALTFSDMQKEFPGLGDSRLRQAIKKKVDEVPGKRPEAVYRFSTGR